MELADTIFKYGKMIERGVVSEMAPRIAKGLVVEILVRKGVSVRSATEWVEKDIILWDTLEEKYQTALRRFGEKDADISWLTPEWVIDAIRQNLPSVASLFLGWRKAHNWLGRQVDIIKNNIGG